ncbi:MAG: lytic murein transglycosylase [Pseudorhodoplanes sp.]|nr:lytic murein transglycosylase [Pseudorhodoplanes sp.]
MMARLAFALVIALVPGVVGAAFAQSAEPTESFETFLQKLWPDAQQRGVTRTTFDKAFAGVTPDPRVMSLTKKQPEYGKPVGEYLAGMVSKDRIEKGRQNLADHADALASVERAYGVDRAVLVAIWGVETSYGRFADRWDVIRSLATLAHARFRDPYFRNELLAALAILQARHIAREKMTGSWAGAMGHTQFMPSSFMDYAVDFSGDGRRDIWTTIPDVLASTAHYLKNGWIPGLPASVEVIVPADFDYTKSRAGFAEWTRRGVRAANGQAFPAEGEAILFFPAGSRGPAFLVTGNFNVIKRYNNSDVYALAVAHLAERLRGGDPIRAPWPRDDRQLTREERIALQRKLAERGHKVRNFTGHFDFDLRDSVRLEQSRLGLVADGHPSQQLLERLGIRPL